MRALSRNECAAREHAFGDRRRIATTVATLIALAVAACGGADTPIREPEVEARAESTPRGHEPVVDDPIGRRCAERNPEVGSCPRWRMAMPEACGGDAPQPSFLDPCRCMCDRCDADIDCNEGDDGRCLAFSSVLLGGYEERSCVYAGNECHPARAVCDSCRAHDGVVSCADPRAIERLRRLDER